MASTLCYEAPTMRTSTKTQPTIRLHEVKTQGRRIHLRAELELDLPLPAQDEHLPATLERAVEDAGQRLKRLLFGQALEHADQQLLLRHTAGKRGEKVRRRGSASYTFKTVFGTVKVRRSRLQDQKSGVTHQPAALAWQTPQQVCITQGRAPRRTPCSPSRPSAPTPSRQGRRDGTVAGRTAQHRPPRGPGLASGRPGAPGPPWTNTPARELLLPAVAGPGPRNWPRRPKRSRGGRPEGEAEPSGRWALPVAKLRRRRWPGEPGVWTRAG